MNIETERLRIRAIRPADLEDFFAYRSDPEVCRFQGYDPIKYEDARDWIAEMEDGNFGVPGKWAQLGVEHKASGRLIGDIGLKSEHDRRIVEYGISVSREFQGQGLASEALSAVLGHLFSELKIHRVIGLVDVDNGACIRMMDRLGFQREAHLRQSFWDHGSWRDEYLYALLASEFK
jgi:RimJ/RimL family protein N-acetyltransferase